MPQLDIRLLFMGEKWDIQRAVKVKLDIQLSTDVVLQGKKTECVVNSQEKWRKDDVSV